MDNKQEKTYAGMTRRTLCLGAGGAAVMLGLGGLKYAGSQPLVRPPGGQDEERLISACIRCEKCYEICPRDVIAPAHLEDGVLNMRTPHVRLLGQLVRLVRRRARRHPVVRERLPHRSAQAARRRHGREHHHRQSRYQHGLVLGVQADRMPVCYDACPYEAMELDENNRPVVIEDKCNGCGACESVCVSLQNGSILRRSHRARHRRPPA